MKSLPRWILFLLGIGVAGSSLYFLTDRTVQNPVFRSLVDNVPWAGYCHVICGSAALILGGVQLSSRIRKRNVRLHETIGKAYVVCVVAGSLGAIVANSVSQSSWTAKSAFWLLAFAWPITTLAGYPWRGRFDVKRHGKLMLFSYAMTCAAISLRLILVTLLTSGVHFRIAYPIAAWGGFLGNLVILQLLFWNRGRSAANLS